MEMKNKYVVQRLKEYTPRQLRSMDSNDDDSWEDINWESDHDTQSKAEERVRHIQTRPVRIIQVSTTYQVVFSMGVNKLT